MRLKCSKSDGLNYGKTKSQSFPDDSDHLSKLALDGYQQR